MLQSIFAFVLHALHVWLVASFVATPLLVTAFLVAKHDNDEQRQPGLVARALLVTSMLVLVLVLIWLVFAPVQTAPRYGVVSMATAQNAPKIKINEPCILPDTVTYQYAPATAIRGDLSPDVSQIISNTHCLNLPRMATLDDLTHACYYYGERGYVYGTPVYDLMIHNFVTLPCGTYAPRLPVYATQPSTAYPGCMLTTRNGITALIWCPTWQEYTAEFGPLNGIMG